MSMNNQRNEIRQEEKTMLGNMWNATVALVRPRFVRFLGLLERGLQAKAKEKLSLILFELGTFIERRRDYGLDVQNMIREVHPDFDPEEHFGIVTKDKEGKETSFTPIPRTEVPDHLLDARHKWFICRQHTKLCDRYIKTVNIYADGLFYLTGTAIVQAMDKFEEGKANLYAIDNESADTVISEYFGDSAKSGSAA